MAMVVDHDDLTLMRYILPIRLRLRGGRCWITTPDGAPALPKAKVDPTLVKGLRNAHRLLARGGPEGIAYPVRSTQYERNLRAVAFLAPDIQRAILDGRQPIGFNLEQLIHGEIPLAWADQRELYRFLSQRKSPGSIP